MPQTTAKTSNQNNGLVNGYSPEGYVIKLSLQPSLLKAIKSIKKVKVTLPTTVVITSVVYM